MHCMYTKIYIVKRNFEEVHSRFIGIPSFCDSLKIGSFHYLFLEPPKTGAVGPHFLNEPIKKTKKKTFKVKYHILTEVEVILKKYVYECIHIGLHVI